MRHCRNHPRGAHDRCQITMPPPTRHESNLRPLRHTRLKMAETLPMAMSSPCCVGPPAHLPATSPSPLHYLRPTLQLLRKPRLCSPMNTLSVPRHPDDSWDHTCPPNTVPHGYTTAHFRFPDAHQTTISSTTVTATPAASGTPAATRHYQCTLQSSAKVRID